jgi:hypothetical protein
MRNTFVTVSAILFELCTISAPQVHAQDTLKNVKKAAVRPIAVKPLPIDPVTGKPRVPINPKTGKPYSHYYGYVASNKNAVKAAHIADSLKKAAAAKTVAVPPVTKPAATPPVVTTQVDKSLNGQYQYLLTKVYNYQQPLVSALWKNVVDSLNANRRKILDLQGKAAVQTKTIADLQADAKTKDDLTAQADEISLLGISLSKSTYNSVMWGLVIILAAIAGIVIARSGKFRHDANYRTGLYNELEEEYKAYKIKANDKEKKLARELQTERNKVDELMGRG